MEKEPGALRAEHSLEEVNLVAGRGYIAYLFAQDPCLALGSQRRTEILTATLGSGRSSKHNHSCHDQHDRGQHH